MTIFQILKESGVTFTKDDCSNVGVLVSESKFIKNYFNLNALPKYKIPVTELNRTFFVRDYPNECREEIESIIVQYFSNKNWQKAILDTSPNGAKALDAIKKVVNKKK